MDDPLWLEAAARVAADLDADTDDDSRALFAAEAARVLLADRMGAVRVRIVGGHVVEGRLGRGRAVADHLVVEGRERALIATRHVLELRGSRPRLRSEDAVRQRSLASELRELWELQEPVVVMDIAGGVRRGRLDFVGADHVGLITEAGEVVLSTAIVSAWLQP